MSNLRCLAGSIGLNIAIATASSHKGDVFAAQTGQWITSVYALSLATNLSSTCTCHALDSCLTLALTPSPLAALLAFKIWSVARKSAQYRSNNIFTPVLRVIIESGAVYSMTITAALISFVVQSNGVYVVLDMVSLIRPCVRSFRSMVSHHSSHTLPTLPSSLFSWRNFPTCPGLRLCLASPSTRRQISPIISIVFNMLIIRIGLANDRSLGTSGTTNGGGGVGVGSGWGPAMTDRSGSAAVRRRADGTFEMRDLKVEITQVVEHDAEYGSELVIGTNDVKSSERLELEGEEDESTTTRGSYAPGKAAERSFAV